MGSKKSSRFEDRFHELFETLFHEIDQEAIAQEIRKLEANNPDQSREWLAKLLIRKASMSAALIGAGAGAPGGALGLLAIAPDIFNLVRQQSRLVLSIAFLYGQRPGTKERFREVLATLAVSTGASAGRQGVRYLIQRGLEGKAVRSTLSRIAGRFTMRKLPSLAPIVGSAAGASINYLTVQATGKIAIDYYSKQWVAHPHKLETKRRSTGSKQKEIPGKSIPDAKSSAKMTSRKQIATGAKRPSVKKAATKKAGAKNAGAKKTPQKPKAKKRASGRGEESR